MATIYYDGLSGSNSTGTGTQSNPYQYPISSHGAVGDRFLLKRGVLHMCANNFGWLPKMAAAPGGLTTSIGAWGEARIPYAILDNNHANGPTMNIGASGTNRAELLVEDVWFKASANPSYPLYLHSQAGALENVMVRRCKATGRTDSLKSGAIVASDNPETQVCKNIVFENCEFYDNAEHGLVFTSVINGVARRCKASNNGLATGAHGFSSFKTRTNLTSGWSGAGPVYQRTMTEITQAATDVSGVIVLIGASTGTYPRFNRKSGDQTTPAAGEYGYVPGAGTGVLYVNLGGANPAGQTLNAAYGTLTGIRYEDCDSWANRAFLGYSFHEGHGFALDDFTGESFIVGCRAWDNEGNGISLNRGDNNTVAGNALWNNWWPAISISRGKNCRILNNFGRNNNRVSAHGTFVNFNTSDIYVGAMSTGTLIQNNVLVSVARDYGLLVDSSSASGSSAVANYLSGGLGRVSGIVESSPVVVDAAAYLDSVGRLRAMRLPDNPLAIAGAYVAGIRLQGGKRPVPGRVPIGAYPEVRI